MQHWRDRATINLDTVYFEYEKNAQIESSPEVYIWDLDKTYLDSSIDSFSGLMRTIFEKSFSKKNVPGTSTLLRSLAQYRKKHFDESFFPLFFVSASPPQMETKIFEKFEIDEIMPVGMFYKDNLKNLSPKRLLFLRKQIGYKLQSMMQLRTRLSETVKIICFGDDSEADAIIYNLFSDICSRRYVDSKIVYLLETLGVTDQQIDEILRLQSVIPIQDPVEKIYINLATDTDPEYYMKFGRRTVPIASTLQTAMDMVQDQRLSLEGLGRVIEVLKHKYGQTDDQLIVYFEDLTRRRVLGLSSFEMIKNFFIEQKMIPITWTSKWNPLKEKIIDGGHVYELDGHYEPWIPRQIDYLTDSR